MRENEMESVVVRHSSNSRCVDDTDTKRSLIESEVLTYDKLHRQYLQPK
jgi:hypothetical protein